MDRRLKERLTGGVILLGLGIIITPILLDEPVDQGLPLEQDFGQVPDRDFDPGFALPKEPVVPRKTLPVTKAAPAAGQDKMPASQPQPTAQGKAPASQPQPTAQGKAPASQPQPTAQDKAPASQPQPAAQGKAPASQPQPTAQDKAPTAKPQPAAQGKAPAAQPQPAAQGKAPATKPQPTAQGKAPAVQSQPTAQSKAPSSTQPSPPLTPAPGASALVGAPSRIVKKKAVTPDALKTTTKTKTPRADQAPVSARLRSSPPGPPATKTERIPSPPLPTKGQSATGEETAADDAVWTVQLGGFSKEENATQLVNKIRTLGEDKYQVFIDTVNQNNGRQIHRVRVGPVSRQQANQQRDELEKELGTRGVIMRDTRNR